MLLKALENETPLRKLGTFLMNFGQTIFVVGVGVSFLDAVINGNQSKVVQFGTQLLSAIFYEYTPNYHTR
jgi:hypothetical protein